MHTHLAKKLYFESCCEELEILKPGNHSTHFKTSNFHVKKFRRAAKISSEILTTKNMSLGKSIFFSSKKCFDQLGSNYNLGIILLCAPIIKVLINGKFSNFRYELKKQLMNIEPDEGNLILEAIKYVQPGGINNYKGFGNVNNKEKISAFYNIMLTGSRWDRISKCYIDYYSEIFDFGLPKYIKIKNQKSRKYANEFIYLNYLSNDKDSHIQRKFGGNKASMIQKKCIFFKRKFENNKINNEKILLNFDRYLKKLHLNPGTCADLTVTTLLMDKIIDIVSISI